MHTTIKDVARVAGVSASTVSRVLAGSPAISPQTHEKVRQVLRDLNYHPHAGARSMVTGSNRTIGLITSRPTDQTFTNPFFPEVIRGLGSILESEGYNVLLSTAHEPTSQRESCLQMLRSRHVDGVILTSSSLGDELIEALVAEKRHFVLIGRPADRAGNLSHPSVHFVNNDNVSAAVAAVEHLVRLGHRRIAFLGGPSHLVYCHDRLTGYRQGLTEAGLTHDAVLVHEELSSQQQVARTMEQLLSHSAPPTAVVASDDLLAFGVMEAVLSRGLRVPGDVAVVGFNDSPKAQWSRPGLTTIRIPVFDLGAMAAKLLVGLLQGTPLRPHQVVLPSQIMVRESTGGT